MSQIFTCTAKLDFCEKLLSGQNLSSKLYNFLSSRNFCSKVGMQLQGLDYQNIPITPLWKMATNNSFMHACNTWISTSVLLPPQVRLDETQMADLQDLRGRLQQELELLMAYQSKIKMHGEAQHQREREILEERVSIRRAVLEEQVYRDLIVLR